MNFLDQTQESWFTSYILINYEFQRRKRNTIIHIMKNRWGYRKAESLLTLTWNHLYLSASLFCFTVSFENREADSSELRWYFCLWMLARFQIVLWRQSSRPNKKELYSWKYSTKQMVTIGEKVLTGGTTQYHTAFGMESHVIKPIAALSVSLWPKTIWLGFFQEVCGNFVICRVCV